MKVADLFCGAGGFSEGFRQAGFDVVLGLDDWEPAIRTHALNHPEAHHIQTDIEELETVEDIDEAIPEVDVIVGGPPCVSFSKANKGGNGDTSEGLNLIERFLRVVAWKKHNADLRYWCMENVPSAEKHIEERYTSEDLDLPDEVPDLEIPEPQRVVYNSAKFGVPQERKRVIIGEYPIPEGDLEEEDWVTVEDVFTALGVPLEPEQTEVVEDPLYDLELPLDEVTDHFYDTRIEEYKWKQARRLKQDHGYYGTMSFPEETDRPSRTVLATRTAFTREAMIFDAENDIEEGDGAYRLPTVREIACFMSYPITYQFEGGSESRKFKLVGNSVPPLLARAIAEEIKEAEGTALTERGPKHDVPDPELDLTQKPEEEREFKEPTKRQGKKFAWHVPHLKHRAFRPVLTNEDSSFDEEEYEWDAVLHKGIGQGMETYRTDKDEIREMIEERPVTVVDDDEQTSLYQGEVRERFDRFTTDLEQALLEELPDADRFQEVFVNRGHGDAMGPHEALEVTRELLDEHFPEDPFRDCGVDNEERTFELPDDEIPVRILVGFFACQFIADIVERGGYREEVEGRMVEN